MFPVNFNCGMLKEILSENSERTLVLLYFYILVFRSEACRVAPVRCIFFLGPSNGISG